MRNNRLRSVARRLLMRTDLATVEARSKCDVFPSDRNARQGVAGNFAKLQGTGGGRFTKETTKIDFQDQTI
jgi:hypothetical protein